MKKLIAVLACTIILATVVPVITLAATNATLFNNLKLTNVKTYDTAMPTKGTKKTLKQMQDLLKKIPYKPDGKGTTTYRAYLWFDREKSAPKGSYIYAGKTKSWYKEIGKSKLLHYYSESTSLIKPDGTSCNLQTADSKYNYYYYWIKGAKEGSFSKYQRTNNNVPVVIPAFKTYPDATVLGEKCFVYSAEEKIDKETYTFYFWVSRKTGVVVKYAGVTKYGTSTNLYFVTQREDKKDSFFTPPKLKWTEYKGMHDERAFNDVIIPNP
jgi:hypothetical protein